MYNVMCACVSLVLIPPNHLSSSSPFLTPLLSLSLHIPPAPCLLPYLTSPSPPLPSFPLSLSPPLSHSLSPLLPLSLSLLLQMGLNIDPSTLLPGATHPGMAQEEKAVSFDQPITTQTLFNPTKVCPTDLCHVLHVVIGNTCTHTCTCTCMLPA